MTRFYNILLNLLLGTSWFWCHCKWWCSKTVLLLPLNLYFFLPSCLPSFSSFFFGDVELKWGDRHPCRPPSLREKMFSLSPLSMLLTLGFSQITGWRKFPFIPSLFRVFIISGCCILSNTFPCMHWDYLEVMCILLIWWSILWSIWFVQRRGRVNGHRTTNSETRDSQNLDAFAGSPFSQPMSSLLFPAFPRIHTEGTSQ